MRLDDGMPFGVPWSNSPPGYFSTRPAVVSGLSKAVKSEQIWAGTDCYLGHIG
jgi:hypothetical protein